MAFTFACASEVAWATGEAEIDWLHSKIGQLVMERDFLPTPSVDERELKARDDRGGTRRSVDLGAMPAAVEARPDSGNAPTGGIIETRD